MARDGESSEQDREVLAEEIALGIDESGGVGTNPFDKLPDQDYSTGDISRSLQRSGSWWKNYEVEGRKLSDYIPPVKWIPAYVRVARGTETEADVKAYGALPYSLRSDVIAGITVGFMLVPQCLAFALLAGLPVQAGLYSSFAPLLVYALMGTIRQVQPGPTALMSLITGKALDSMGLLDPNERLNGACLMSVLVGIISVSLGVLQCGFIVDFMSHSVMSAFCSAAGITIATSQLKYMFGITMERHHYWWQTVGDLLLHLPDTDGATFVLAWALLGLLLLLKYWKSAGSQQARLDHKFWRYMPTDKGSLPFRVLKTVADLSSLLAVVVGWILGAAYRAGGVDSVKIVGRDAVEDVDGFIFVLPGSGVGNFDFGVYLQAAITAAIVGFLETVAVGGKFAMQARYDFDPNQELIALGAANVVGGLMSGYPTTGSFSRTAVNAMLGATSLVACAISSLLVALATYLLLDVVAMLPYCSLAAIIIQGAIGVIDFHEFQVAWKANGREFFVMAATFLVALGVGVKWGLAAGFLLSILVTMYELSNPNMVVTGRLPNGVFRDIRHFPDAEQLPNAVVVRMDARLNFANARKLREFCARVLQLRIQQQFKIKFMIIDARAMNAIDLTGCSMLEMLAESCYTNGGVKLVVAGLKAPVARSLIRAEVDKVVKKFGGALGDVTLEQAVEITQGKTNMRMSKDLRALVAAHDEAMDVLGSHNLGFLSSFKGRAKGPPIADSGDLRRDYGGAREPQSSACKVIAEGEEEEPPEEEPVQTSQTPAMAAVSPRDPTALVVGQPHPPDDGGEAPAATKTTALPPPPRAACFSNLTSTVFSPCGTHRLV